MKNFFIAIAITLSSFSLAQEQLNPNLIIDLTEQQALERYKSSNVRKALKLKIKDFNYKELIQYAVADKLSEILILNNYSTTEIENIKNIYNSLKLSYNNLKEASIGYPLEDYWLLLYDNIEELKQHHLYITE